MVISCNCFVSVISQGMMDGSHETCPLSVSSEGRAPHVRRLKTLKRNKAEKEITRKVVKLETVLGVTVTSNASLATAPGTGIT